MEKNTKTQSREQKIRVTFRNSQGAEVQAVLRRMARNLAVFEIYSPDEFLRTSEVLSDFKILLDDRPVYSGRAVVSSLVNLSTLLVCEATLEDSWCDAEIFSLATQPEKLRESYQAFISQWQGLYKVQPDFKLLITEMQMFLTDLRLWLDQVEPGIRSMPAGDRMQLEQEIVRELGEPIIPSINSLFEKFEIMAARIEEEWRPMHHAYVKRQLHPLVLCAPFAFRTFTKPLGYAGDYEMVNMIIRNPHEGGSLFAKLLNVWFLRQPPAQAHRNRIVYLTEKLVAETSRVCTQNRPARIFNLGCGPAGEVQNFLRQHPLCERADLTLLDFNDETLAYTGKLLGDLKLQHSRTTPIELVKKSVVQILKGAGKMVEGGQKYDYLYCAGLFDYLPDRVCKQLMNIFYDMVAPGGLLVVTNVDASNPIRHMLDYVPEWHLIYRTGRQLVAVGPDRALPDEVTVKSDDTGVNIYMEVRKPPE